MSEDTETAGGTESQTDGGQLADILPSANESDKNSATDNQPLIQNQKADKPAGYHPVDLSNLPEDVRKPIEERFRYMYGQIKGNERKVKEVFSIADQQAQKIEELMSGVGQVVDHLQNKSLDDLESQAKSQLRAAHESGDIDGFITANDRLSEIKAKKLLAAERAKSQKTERPKQTNQYRSASEIASSAEMDGELSSDDGRAISAWQSETDSSGATLRPWAHSRNPENPTADPLYRRALIESAAVFDEASPWASKTTAEKLAEIDRRMGLTRNSGSQSVMGGNMGGQLTTQRKSAKLTLTPEQEKIAIRMNVGAKHSSKPRSDAEKIQAYLDQMKKVSARGAK
jgi:hypothetical protein